MKTAILLFALFLTSALCLAQEDDHATFLLYQRGKAAIFSQGNDNGPILADASKVQSRFYSMKGVGTFGTDEYISMDASFFAALPMEFLTKKPVDSYALSLVEFGYGWTFNKSSPLRIGPAEIRLGMGLNLGARVFSVIDSVQYLKNAGGLIASPVFHSFINVGDRFQIFNTNEFGIVYTPTISGFRSKFDFIATYKLLSWLGLTVNPNFERVFLGEKDNSTEVDHHLRFRYLQLGFTLINVF